MQSNPWSELDTSINNINLNGILADKNHLLEFYWAKDSSGNLSFVLQTVSEIILNRTIPHLNGIDISITQHDKNNQLVFTLVSRDDRDIFYSLCMNLIRSTKNMSNEIDAIKTILRRLEKWQIFLKNNEKRIDKKHLKGLIGELYFLKTYLLKNHDVKDALTFWRAPSQSVQDFEFNNVTVEVKTKTSVNSITISSYEQLFTQLDYLLLYVVTLNESTEKSPGSFNIYHLIDDIRVIIQTKNPKYQETFDDLLMDYPFIELEEYTEHYFIFVSDEFYEVKDDFPKIKDIPAAIDNLKYRINLDMCKEYLADNSLLERVGILYE